VSGAGAASPGARPRSTCVTSSRRSRRRSGPMSAAEQLSMAPLPYRVRRRIRETGDTWTLELDPVGRGVELRPGQFTMLYAFGVGEVPISVSGDLTRPGPLVHTIRVMGAVTQRLCALRRGDLVGVRGPCGNGWPVGAAAGRDVV